jgi:hypothetical protein
VHITISQKNTTSGSKLELVRIVGSKVWPTDTTEDTKIGVSKGKKIFVKDGIPQDVDTAL